jgi:23S rRNA (adenine2503-C2)-methyltransferase
VDSIQQSDGRTELKGLFPDELESFVGTLGLETYRARQISAWIYNRGVTEFDEMTNLSKQLRLTLSESASILDLDIVQEQGAGGDTVKYLFGLRDGSRIESVLMREGKRRTLCISSQVGCPLDCHFCATGRMGLIRNLSAAEILDQLIKVRRSLLGQGEDLTNVVLMGMGEPLLNFEAVMRAIRLMNLDYGPAVGIRRITLSTVGQVPGILKLSREGLKVGLAVSLNATTDEQRSQIMPINKKWPISELLDAVRAYHKKINRRVTFEYVLLHGFNDSIEDARRLVGLVRDISCKINLIPWNPIPDAPYESPSQSAINAFLQVLTDGFLTATVRYSKGTDISAGCGQLFQEMSAT